MKIRSKQYFDARVADEEGLRRSDVARVTQAFLEALVDSLAALEEVQFAGAFRLKIAARKGPAGQRNLVVVRRRVANKTKERVAVAVDRQFYLTAKKSDRLGRLLREKHGPPARTEKNDARKVRR